MQIDFRLVWFDSFGAKSSCTLVKTDDVSILIDPGIAIMHASFPASLAKKVYWREKGAREIRKAFKHADVVVISHYHWDHFLREAKLYKGKLILAKNPNEYINDSQRKRACDFFGSIFKELGIEVERKKTRRRKFEDPAKKLRSVRLDFGDYNQRRKELLKKGEVWFRKRAEKWKRFWVIPEVKTGEFQLIFPEGRTFRFGKTKLRFTRPLFHGIEYSRVGWVFSTIVERGREKLIHSSDLNGPIIEDYADFIIRENPTYLILDGPMTYMLGYTLNLINFGRVLKNAKRIVRKVDFKVMIWDHHLPREPKFRERTSEVWELARKLNKNLQTASEYQLGKLPVVERL